MKKNIPFIFWRGFPFEFEQVPDSGFGGGKVFGLTTDSFIGTFMSTTVHCPTFVFGQTMNTMAKQTMAKQTMAKQMKSSMMKIPDKRR